MNSVLARNELDASFTLLARRSMPVAAEPGLTVHVRGGELRVREGDSARMLEAGACYVASRAGVIELKALAHAELHIEWPGPGTERLSPGLEPLAWPQAPVEPIAQAARP